MTLLQKGTLSQSQARSFSNRDTIQLATFQHGFDRTDIDVLERKVKRQKPGLLVGMRPRTSS